MGDFGKIIITGALSNLCGVIFGNTHIFLRKILDYFFDFRVYMFFLFLFQIMILGEMKKILIIDDNLENREILGLLFEDEGFEVKLCSGPENVEHELISFAPQVVLMDVMMDGYNGIEVCQRLKSNDKFINIKVVLMTASHALTDVDLNVTNADAYVFKPFDINELAIMIKKLISA